MFRRYTTKTLSLNQVRRELPSIRKRGYALNDQATTTEHRAVAAPVLAPSGVTVGAVNISVSALRYSMSAVERQLAPEVVRTAQQVSQVVPPNVLGAGWLPEELLIGD